MTRTPSPPARVLAERFAQTLAPFEIPYQKGLPAFAGWRAENPAAAPLTTTDHTFGADPWSSIA